MPYLLVSKDPVYRSLEQVIKLCCDRSAYEFITSINAIDSQTDQSKHCFLVAPKTTIEITQAVSTLLVKRVEIFNLLKLKPLTIVDFFKPSNLHERCQPSLTIEVISSLLHSWKNGRDNNGNRISPEWLLSKIEEVFNPLILLGYFSENDEIIKNLKDYANRQQWKSQTIKGVTNNLALIETKLRSYKINDHLRDSF